MLVPEIIRAGSQPQRMISMVDILSERAATQTGSELFGLLGVVALNPEYAVIFYVQSNRTSAAAVKSIGGANDSHIAIRLAIPSLLNLGYSKAVYTEAAYRINHKSNDIETY